MEVRLPTGGREQLPGPPDLGQQLLLEDQAAGEPVEPVDDLLVGEAEALLDLFAGGDADVDDDSCVASLMSAVGRECGHNTFPHPPAHAQQRRSSAALLA